MPDDFIMTIDSDAEIDSELELPTPSAPGPSKSESKAKATKATTAKPDAGADTLNPDLVFDLSGEALDYLEDGLQAQTLGIVKTGTKLEPISVDDIIARRKLSNKRKRQPQEDEESDLDDSGSESAGGLESDPEDDPLATSDEEGDDDDEEEDGDDDSEGEQDDGDDDEDDEDSGSGSDSDEETQAEKDRKAAFFDSETPSSSSSHSSFLTMNLSRPILKSITNLGFQKPTPIQAATIPVALLGKDIVGNAVTGSGKTAAFMIPMLERLLFREKGAKAAATRCLVLVPTRELAVQCVEVGTKLANHTDIRLALIVGGLSLKSQEATLRTRPDIIIATPGRLIDHVHNSPSFSLDALDVLVLDEADRMLSDGFADELAEIIKACPRNRQTMLFSATMTDSVDSLIKMSLDKPVRLFVDPKRTTAKGLIQEFIRVRAEKEKERSALLVTLCKRTFKERVIIFLRSKKLAHQMRVVFSLVGLRCEELHGDLTQEQRLKALQLFKDGAVDYLMATDLASRGLDIKGIETVINYDMPGQLAQYMHRIGRTARAGKKGCAVTLVGEADRKMLKTVIKHSPDDQVKHRIVPADALTKWATKIEDLKDEVAAILNEEKEEKHLRKAEMELKKGQNILEHSEEIYSRPARTWFQTGKQKEEAEAISKRQYEQGFTPASSSTKKQAASSEAKPKRDKFSGLSRRAKRRKLAAEEDAEYNDRGATDASIRSAKKAARPPKIGEADRRAATAPAALKKAAKKARKKAVGKKMVAGKGGVFDKDFSARGGGASREGVRAKKGDKIGGMKKGGGKAKKGK